MWIVFNVKINQNMDKRNERYVMQQLLARGKQKGTAPQTFVITPKLLSEFPYTIRCLNNG